MLPGSALSVSRSQSTAQVAPFMLQVYSANSICQEPKCHSQLQAGSLCSHATLALYNMVLRVGYVKQNRASLSLTVRHSRCQCCLVQLLLRQRQFSSLWHALDHCHHFQGLHGQCMCCRDLPCLSNSSCLPTVSRHSKS